MTAESRIMTRIPSPFSFFPTICFLFIFCLSPMTSAAPKSEYWDLWDGSNPQSNTVINHDLWQEVLDEYLIVLSSGNRFRYKSVMEADQAKLKEYIRQLSSLNPTDYTLAEQKAFWINLYNALTVDLILEHYPVESIIKIGPWFRFGPWDDEIISVSGQPLTLNDIEHRILRPLWEDNRIHYAVNCASKGCPELSAKAFTGTNTERQLDQLAARYVRQDKGVAWIDGRLVLSRIYEWYEVDFIDQDGVLLHLQQYATPASARKLKEHTGLIEYRYDWQLNELD